jgi:XTP/dITP diphosphohydrolase
LRFVLATRNKGKLRELRSVLSDFGAIFLSLDDFPDVPDVVEDGLTFADNARLKAEHYYRLTGVSSIADDSGLMVDALGGRPGVFSARLAADDASRIQAVLRELSEVAPLGTRGAQFVCALCLVQSESRSFLVEGVVRGEIVDPPRGNHGFGYDPIFLYPPLGRTFAELTPDEKNRVSHRALALRKLRDGLPAELGRS